jgi:hypothetical protein
MLGVTYSVIHRSYWPIVTLAIFAAFSAGFAAVKFLPDYVTLHRYPRPWDFADWNSLQVTSISLFSRFQDFLREHPGGWGFWEHGAYIGPIAAVLALFGAVKYPRGAVPWIIAGLVFLMLSTGHSSRYSLWGMLHVLPMFSSSRVPSRFLIPFTLTVGVLASFGGEAILKRYNSVGFYIVALALCAMLIDFWLVSVPNLRSAVPGDLPDSVATSPSFRQVREQSDIHMLAASMANEGALNCESYTGITTPAAGFNQPTYRGEQYLLGPGSVRSTDWTPNAIDFEVDAPAATTMIVNQNYDPYWQLVEGHGRILNSGGLLAVDLPAGKQTLRLAYRSRSLRIGAAISTLTLLLAVAVVVGERRRRVAR